MAQQTSTNNDLDIKLGITIEDYATVAAKIDDLIKKLQTDKKFTIKVDLKDINKQTEEAKKGLSKIKTEFDDVGRGFTAIKKAMKATFETKDNTVSVTSKGNKRMVKEFTVSIIKAGEEIEKLTYKWNKAKDGFVFQDKTLVDKSSINDANKNKKIQVERKGYNTTLGKINRTTSKDILDAPEIKAQIDDIKKRIKSLDKMTLSEVNQETKLLTKDFMQLKESIAAAKAAEKARKAEEKANSQTNTSKSKKSSGIAAEKIEVVQLSREYNKLYAEINKLYGGKGEISIISKGELNEINAFTVKIKESEASIKELKYAWGTDGKSEGFIKQDIKNIDKRQEVEEKALKETQKLNANIAKQKEEAAKKEVERLNQISNLRKDYAIKLQNTTREHSGAMKDTAIANELKKFQQELKNLDSVPIDKMKQKTAELSLAWKQFQANIKQTSSIMRSQKYDTWIDAISKKTKEFFTWYISANAVMAGRNFLMDSVRQINEMDTAVVELSKVSDLSTTSLSNMSSAAIELSKSLGKVNASEIMLSMAEFGRVTKNVKEIEELARVKWMPPYIVIYR